MGCFLFFCFFLFPLFDWVLLFDVFVILLLLLLSLSLLMLLYYCYYAYSYSYSYYYYYYYYYYVLRKLVGKPSGFSAQDAILCQNRRMSHEKQRNALHIYVKSGAIMYPQPRIRNSVGWTWSRVGA